MIVLNGKMGYVDIIYDNKIVSVYAKEMDPKPLENDMHQLSPRVSAHERSNSISKANSAQFQPCHRGHHFGDS